MGSKFFVVVFTVSACSTALAQAGVAFEKKNPVTSLMDNRDPAAKGQAVAAANGPKANLRSG